MKAPLFTIFHDYIHVIMDYIHVIMDCKDLSPHSKGTLRLPAQYIVINKDGKAI